MEIILRLISEVLFFEVPIFGVTYQPIFLVAIGVSAKLLSYIFGSGGK